MIARHSTPSTGSARVEAIRASAAGARTAARIGAFLLVWAAVTGCAPPAVVRAQAMLRGGQDAEAIELLQARVRDIPDDVAARKLLVRALADSGDVVAARREVDALAARLPPGDPSPSIELGHAFELAHRYDDALDAYDRAAALAPGSPDGPREGGLRSANWGEPELARPRLEEAVRRGADDAETWHALGLVRLHLGDLDAAEQAYRRGALRAPRSAECYLGLASVALTRGDAAAALAAYDQVLVRRPRSAAAELGRAWALAQLGRLDEAARSLDRAEMLGAPAAPLARQRAALRR